MTNLKRTPMVLALMAALSPCLLPAAAQAVDANTVLRLHKITVRAKKNPSLRLIGLGEGLSDKDIFESTQTAASIDRAQIRAAGPLAGGAQIAEEAPGINVYGYSGAGTGRYEIVSRGIKVGWSSVNGDVERNGLTILFDGIPMMNMAAHNGGWDSNEIPIAALIQNVNVIYGTGNPLTRWYDSLGGTIDFIPVQPRAHAGGFLGVMFGNNSSYGVNGVVRTGIHDGWTGVLGYGYQYNHTFRTGTFNAPSHASAFFAKATKLFGTGSLSFGAYVNRATEYRPNFIPLTPIAGVTTQGLNATAPLYSQPTSGYYYSLPESIWFKRLKVNSEILYAKLRVHLSRNLTLHDTAWYRHGYREHYRIVNYIPNNQNNSEFYNPYTNTYGDKAYLEWALPDNVLDYGGWVAREVYNTKYAGYNQAFGTSPTYPLFYNSDFIYSTFLNAFAQDRVSLSRRFNLTPGLSLIQYRTRTFDNAAADFPNAPANAQNLTATPNVSKQFTELEPSLGARYNLDRSTALYGNYSITYQNPTDNAFGAYVSTPIDLGTLKPIRSADGELGIKFLFPRFGWLGRFSLNANYFQTRIDNETISTYLTNINEIKFAFASAKLQGFTVDASARPNYDWHLYSSMTYLRSHYMSFIPAGSSTNYAGYPISNSPRLTATVGAVYKFEVGGLRYRLAGQDQYVGSRYLFSNIIGGPTYQTMPSYNIVNAVLGTRLGLGSAGSLSLSVGIDNLFDTQYNPTAYITSGGYFGGNSTGAILVDPGAPRQYYFSGTWHF